MGRPAGLLDLTGQRFEKLVAVSYAGHGPAGALWRFRCDCGGEAIYRGQMVRMGRRKSCGCLRRRRLSVGTPERLWANVNQDGPVVRQELGPCWVWTGRTDRKGYGRMHSTKRVLAHRISWEVAYGPIPDGFHACHRCDNPPCVRPSHLFLGTDKDNVADMISKGRAAWQKGSSDHA